ncbi:MAG: hypothetical protein M3R24_14085 [Chloroflexota bacterium]|nr:hypothetical protein [Chloroflexota bacterium]
MYNTPNRTIWSKLVLIKLLQEWRWTRLLAPRTHDWQMFIRPPELQRVMVKYDIAQRDITGLSLAGNVCRVAWMWSTLKRGRISYGAAGRKLEVSAGSWIAIDYIGYGVKQHTAGTIATTATTAADVCRP